MFHGFFFMFRLFFENERSIGDNDFYDLFLFCFFCFLLFIASDRADFLHLPFSTVPHNFFLKRSVLLFSTLALSEVALS